MAAITTQRTGYLGRAYTDVSSCWYGLVGQPGASDDLTIAHSVKLEDGDHLEFKSVTFSAGGAITDEAPGAGEYAYYSMRAIDGWTLPDGSAEWMTLGQFGTLIGNMTISTTSSVGIINDGIGLPFQVIVGNVTIGNAAYGFGMERYPGFVVTGDVTLGTAGVLCAESGPANDPYMIVLGDVGTTAGPAVFTETDGTGTILTMPLGAKVTTLAAAVDASTTGTRVAALALVAPDNKPTVDSSGYTAVQADVDVDEAAIATAVVAEINESGVVVAAAETIGVFPAAALANTPSTSASVTITPAQISVSPGEAKSHATLYAYQYAKLSYTLTITDAAGAAIDLTSKSLSMVFFDAAVPSVAVFTLATTGESGDNLAVSGDDGNIVTVTGADTHTQTARRLSWVLRNLTDDSVIGSGKLEIIACPA